MIITTHIYHVVKRWILITWSWCRCVCRWTVEMRDICHELSAARFKTLHCMLIQLFWLVNPYWLSLVINQRPWHPGPAGPLPTIVPILFTSGRQCCPGRLGRFALSHLNVELLSGIWAELSSYPRHPAPGFKNSVKLIRQMAYTWNTWNSYNVVMFWI